jgi:hypothetical protein
VLVIDLFPPGRHDPHGLHAAVRQQLQRADEQTAPDGGPPPDEPVSLVSYAAGPSVEVFMEHAPLGAALPDMPLFLRPNRYIVVPLDATYQAAFRGMPAYWRDLLESGLARPA